MTLRGVTGVAFKHGVGGVWRSRSQRELLETPRKDFVREAARTASPCFPRTAGYEHEESGRFCLLALLLLRGAAWRQFRSARRRGTGLKHPCPGRPGETSAAKTSRPPEPYLLLRCPGSACVALAFRSGGCCFLSDECPDLRIDF